MKRTVLFLLPVLVAATCTTGGPGADQADAAGTITPADVHDRIAFLASDALRGRNTPSPGLDSAAQWVADQMASFGLEPGGDDGWFQRYPYPAVGLDTDGTRLQVAGGQTHTFGYGADYFARPGTTPGQAVGLLYVGEFLPEEARVADQAVVVRLHGTAEEGRRGVRLDRQARGTVYQTMSAASEAGAAAVIFVLDPAIGPDAIADLAVAEEVPARAYGGVQDEAVPPAFFLRHEAGSRLFRMAGLDAEAIFADGPPDTPVPLAGVTAVAAAPRLVVDDATAPNVVGILRGSDPALSQTYVVLSAHMDHVGVGRPDASGDSIYNGADDDASGTAVMVEVAQALASMPRPPRRSVLFVAVSGEEKGLLGSRWFADHPTVPLESMVADVNLDMVGRNAPDSIVVIGQEYSSLGPLVQRIAADRPELGLIVSEDLWPEERFFFRSDHFSFAAKEIPALFFFAGTHEDYHRPSDEVDTVDTDKAARVGRLVFYLTDAIAESESPPEWDPDGLATVRELTSR
jgi:hypothetical protein